MENNPDLTNNFPLKRTRFLFQSLGNLLYLGFQCTLLPQPVDITLLFPWDSPLSLHLTFHVPILETFLFYEKTRLHNYIMHRKNIY